MRVEANFVAFAAIIDCFDVALRRRGEIDDLSVLKRIQATVFNLQIAQQDDDDLLAEILRLAHLGDTFRRGKRLR